LFLYGNLHPGFDPWPFVGRYWPLLLVFIGLGKLWDYYRYRSNPEAGGRWLSGGEIAFIVLLAIFFLVLSLGRIGRYHQASWAESIDRRDAQSVSVTVEMPAGDLHVDSGGSKLLDADFAYDSSLRRPDITYSVDSGHGELRISQREEHHVQFGPTHDTWNLHLARDVPMEMRVNMGAGRNDLHLGGLQITRVEVAMGAGLLTADLTGDWKQDLEADFRGGAGNATIRLPDNVGVVARAKGGFGSVEANGLIKEGDVFVNAAYGKSPVTLHVNVEGGAGVIRLEPAPLEPVPSPQLLPSPKRD
jgi:hypothetical protein